VAEVASLVVALGVHHADEEVSEIVAEVVHEGPEAVSLVVEGSGAAPTLQQEVGALAEAGDKGIYILCERDWWAHVTLIKTALGSSGYPYGESKSKALGTTIIGNSGIRRSQGSGPHWAQWFPLS